MKRDEFVSTWNNAASLEEVSSKAGVSKSSCSVRASLLRKDGVELKRFKKRGESASSEAASATPATASA